MEGTICKRKNKIINFWSSPYLPQKKKKKISFILMIWLLNDHGFFKAKEKENLLVRKREKNPTRLYQTIQIHIICTD
jgi:hypothetical protein